MRLTSRLPSSNMVSASWLWRISWEIAIGSNQKRRNILIEYYGVLLVSRPGSVRPPKPIYKLLNVLIRILREEWEKKCKERKRKSNGELYLPDISVCNTNHQRGLKWKMKKCATPQWSLRKNFPIREWSLSLLRQLKIFLPVIESNYIEKKKDHSPGSVPDLESGFFLSYPLYF